MLQVRTISNNGSLLNFHIMAQPEIGITKEKSFLEKYINGNYWELSQWAAVFGAYITPFLNFLLGLRSRRRQQQVVEDETVPSRPAVGARVERTPQ